MSSLFRNCRSGVTRAIILALLGVIAVSWSAAIAVTRKDWPGATLRVCADPNNLPFSNARREGFENQIAELIARERHQRVEYTWWAQRRGFTRNTLNANSCDIIVGIAAGYDLALTTRPYYRSGYVFVTRRASPLRIRSLDDSVLRSVRVGVQTIGDDYMNSPPVHALARRGIIDNVRGFSVTGNYAEPNPPARIIDALARGDIDVAIAWGPLAGYFAQKSDIDLEIHPVSPSIDLPFLPFVFDIAMGVRRGDTAFRKEIDAIIVANRSTIDSILSSYGVPRFDVPGNAQERVSAEKEP
jgi:mxaJ protein